MIGLIWQQGTRLPDNIAGIDGGYNIIVSDPNKFDYPSPVALIRFVPAGWWGNLPIQDLLAKWVTVCKYATFANEPDIEGVDTLYNAYCSFWRQLGGILVGPAYSNQNKWKEDNSDILGVHCYANNWTNYYVAKAQSNGRRLWVTEYGNEQNQTNVLNEIAHCDVYKDEQLKGVFIFIWEWLGNANSGYNVYNKTLLPITSVPVRKETVSKTNYCTELGPDHSGHNRCGVAAVCSDIMKRGGNYDPYQLLLQITKEVPYVETDGMTPEQMQALLKTKNFTPTLWVRWQEAIDALDKGHYVHCLVDNWFLRPRSYPAGANWDALHWITLVAMPEEGYLYVYDPLTYVGGEYPVNYQGPVIYTADSVKLAIQATPNPYGGVLPNA